VMRLYAIVFIGSAAAVVLALFQLARAMGL
jgi:hypothetical protein